MKHHECGSGEPKAEPGRRQGGSFAPGESRREFLKVVAALGAGAIVPAGALIAQTAGSGARPKTGRIDVHHHFLPPAYITGTSAGRTHSNWTPAVAMADMDKYGTATAVVSIASPGAWTGNAEESRKLARGYNEYGAQMMHDNPARFGLFAAVPFPDVDGTLKEIEHAFDVLKADGIGIITSYNDKWPGDPLFMPIWQELNRRKAVVFIHPTNPACCSNFPPGVGAGWTEFDFDSMRAVESLLINGVTARCPDVRIIITHSGGVVPVLAGRINDRFPKNRPDLAPQGVLYELKKLYYECAHATYPPPLAALVKFAPVSQFLFGTDYPMEPTETTTKALGESDLTPRILRALARENAERLFPRLKG